MKLQNYLFIMAGFVALAILTDDTLPLFQKFWFLALASAVGAFGDLLLKNISRRSGKEFTL